MIKNIKFITLFLISFIFVFSLNYINAWFEEPSHSVSNNVITLKWTALSGDDFIDFKACDSSLDVCDSFAIVQSKDEKFVLKLDCDFVWKYWYFTGDGLWSFYIWYFPVELKNWNYIWKWRWSVSEISVHNYALNCEKSIPTISIKVDEPKVLDDSSYDTWSLLATWTDILNDNFINSVDAIWNNSSWEKVKYNNIDNNSTKFLLTEDPFFYTEPVKKSIKWNWYVWGDQFEILDNWYTREQYNAYKFAYVYWLTDAISIWSANLDWELSRAALAKMMASFAKNVMKLKPNTWAVCAFADVPYEFDLKYNFWITDACKLWIMWIWISNFKPHDNVLRSEFATVLSRLVFWTVDWNPFYQPHIKILSSNWILSNKDPYKVEKRWNVLLMLMRTALNVIKYIQDDVVEQDTWDVKSTFYLNKYDEQTLLNIVSAVDPNLIDYAKYLLYNEWTWEFISYVWADLSKAHICHVVAEDNDKVYFYWDMVPYSTEIEVKLYRYNHWVKIWTLSMLSEKAQFNIEWSKMMFAFVPKNTEGNEFRYDVDTKNYGTTCTKNKWLMSDEVILTKYNLWRVTDVIWMLVPLINSKDEKSKNNVMELLKSYKESKDEFTRNIWIYLEHLLKNS